MIGFWEDLLKAAKPLYYDSVAGLVDEIITRFDKKILFGMPIGLGKSYHIANEMYRRAKEDREIRLSQSLRRFKSKIKHEKVSSVTGLIRQLLGPVPAEANPYLKRMQLDNPGTLRERIARKTVTYALKSAGYIPG